MRKLLAFPGLLLILACGGSGIGTDTFSYPNTRTLEVSFRNTTNAPAKLWTEPEETEPATFLASGSSRTVNVARTWDNESAEFVFTFKGRGIGGQTLTSTISINGQESHAQNFSGFWVEWREDNVSGQTYLHSETK
jgi:hypothetical protein